MSQAKAQAAAARLSAALLSWYDRAGRHDLPWQHPRSAYRVWVAEIMLQQTQVATVLRYYLSFLERFPDLKVLATAELDAVLAAWSGLGYYRRARHLHQAAQRCLRDHGGELPQEFDALAALPGIGRSTAGAILAQACDQPWPILDGNVRRVLSRLDALALPADRGVGLRRLWARAAELVPAQRAGDYTQAVMDLGATLCTPRQPDCPRCPWREDCLAHAQGTVERYPVKTAGASSRPERSAWFLLLRSAAGEVLLERRSALGVWSELWCLPEYAELTLLDAELKRLGAAAGRSRDPIRHDFTHYRLWMHVVEAELESPLTLSDGLTQWRSPAAALSLGLPQPVRRVLAECG